MRLLLDEKDLALLLEKNRENITNKVSVDTVIAVVSFLLSAFSGSFSGFIGIPGIVVKTVFCIIGILFAAKVAKGIYNMLAHKFNHEVLLKNITDLNMIQHEHSLCVIKDSFSGKERYLVYYDGRWDCKFFPNYRTNAGDNETYLVKCISNDLELNEKNIYCKYITSKIQTKFSESHNENRVYNHRLYQITVPSMPKKYQKDDFVVGDRHYFWMTIEEMKQDANIVKKNLDVVHFVQENESNM